MPFSGEFPPALARAAQLGSVVTRLRPHDVATCAAPSGAPTRRAARAPDDRGTQPPDAETPRRSGTARRDRAAQRRHAAAAQLQGRHARRLDDATGPARVSLGDTWRRCPSAMSRRYVERQRRIYESAVACCGATHWVADSIINDYGIPPERVFTVGFGPNHEPASRLRATGAGRVTCSSAYAGYARTDRQCSRHSHRSENAIQTPGWTSSAITRDRRARRRRHGLLSLLDPARAEQLASCIARPRCS